MLTTVNKIYRKEIYIILSKCIDNHTICLCISIFYIAAANKITGTQAENVQQKANSVRIARAAKGLPQTGETMQHVLQAIGITLMMMGALIFVDTKFKKG